MNPRGHPELAAVLTLLALVLSAMALLPATAQAASQVTGLVGQCNSPLYVNAATVTLVDANGVLAPQSFTTGSDGVYAFTQPPSANYTLTATAAGFYSGGVSTPFRFDGSSTVSMDFCLTSQLPAGKTSLGVTIHVQDATTGTFIGGATVSVYNATREAAGLQALIGTQITNGTAGPNAGNVSFGLWKDTDFDVRVNATGYGVYIQTTTISASGTIVVKMSKQFTVVGHAKSTSGQFLSAGLVATLYRLDVKTTNVTRVIPAAVSGSLYTFYAPAGIYKRIVDANGYTANETWLNLTGTPTTLTSDAILPPSRQETFLTTVLFGAKDWNNITVYRNWTLHSDSTLAGLNPSGLRDLREQINFTFGDGHDGNGTLSPNDVTKFTTWILQNGPLYVTTDAFLLVNDKSYISDPTNYVVVSMPGLTTPGADVHINTRETYHLKSTAWIIYGQPKYYLNMTVLSDTNTTVYHNETYIVDLPAYYEMTSDTILPTAGAITTQNYTRITVDPGLNGKAIQMVIQQALTGIAREKVIGPSGQFYVVNSTYQHYQAYVAENANITFSAAETSNPPSNDPTRDNFTWAFLSNGSFLTPPNNLRYGIQPTYSFSPAGAWIVNLTAIGSGGNKTYRNIDIWVDGTPPVGDFKTNRTGSGSAKGADLNVNQGTVIRFDGGLSTDQAYTGKAGVILNSGYAWDFNQDNIADATGRVVNWTFSTPGHFIVNLTVTDCVGNKASNVSLTITVNDTEAPKPGFRILDPSNEYAVAPTLIEGRNYTFNASTTTDNYDKLSALNFTWYISGLLIGEQGNLQKKYGLNLTFGWSSWNLSYQIKLVVNDTGFGSGKPNSGTLFQNISVQIDQTLHPDLYLTVSSVKISTSSPESGQTVTVTVNVTDKVGWGPATQIYVSVQETGSSQPSYLSPTWSMANANGTTVSTLASGATATMTISFAVTGQGNRTLTITVADRNEPYTHITAENRITESIVVQQPAWVNYAIIGSVVAVFAVVIFAMYYRRKVKAGDWQPRFRREKGEGGKEKPRKEKEVKEEKKRL